MTIQQETPQSSQPLDIGERNSFQAFLDETFPIGATCAVLSLDIGHLGEASPTTTGRLVCTETEEDRRGTVKYRIVIDPRDGHDSAPTTVAMWIDHPRPHEGSDHLWQATVQSDEPSDRVLRLNAEPRGEWRPTPAMRSAVTAAYPELLTGASD